MRDGAIRPEALSPIERRVVERATVEALRLAAFASAGVPVEPAERAAWLRAPEGLAHRPAPPGLVDRREHEPLGAWLARMCAEGRAEEAERDLHATLAPIELLELLIARIRGEYDLRPPPAEDVLRAIERAGLAGIAAARGLLTEDRLRQTPDGDDELGWGLGAHGNAALLALARAEQWTEIPERYVAFLSFDGPPSWFSELMAKLTPADRARVATAGARRTPTTRLRRGDYECLARVLAEGRSAEATRVFADRARATPRGEAVIAELRAVSNELGLVIPGL